MSSQVNWKAIGIFSVALIGIASIAFVVGQRFVPTASETVSSTASKQMMKPVVGQKTAQMPAATESESYVDKDVDFVTYTNTTFGFVMDLPKRVLIAEVPGTAVFDSNACEKLVAVRAYPVTDGVIIAPEKFFDGKTCLPMTAEVAEKERFGWKIVAAPAKNDADLSAFIRANYGGGTDETGKVLPSSCLLGKKTASTLYPGLFSIEIKQPSDASGENCILNYAVSMQYAPKVGKVFTWNPGNGNGDFVEDYRERTDGSQDPLRYDEKMSASFHVLGE